MVKMLLCFMEVIAVRYGKAQSACGYKVQYDESNSNITA